MELWTLWLIAFLLLAVIEVVTQWLTTFCFAVGSLVALLGSLCGVAPLYQLLMLSIATIASFFIFAPYFQRFHERKGLRSKSQSNMDAIIGRVVEVSQEIDGTGLGRVKVDGDNWQARSFDGSTIRKSAQVEIVDYDSIILVVKPL
jgi:membrane protein implicated in regulation of membrane protease activity